MRTRIQKPLTKAEAQERYISEAAYYFFRAVGQDENLASALHRMAAREKRDVLEAHGWPIPRPGTLYKRAVALFGKDRCHTAPPKEPQP